MNIKTAKISTSPSGNISKLEFLTGKDVLPKKDLLGKAAAIKIVEYFPLDTELKAQASAAEKQYLTLGEVFEPNKKEQKSHAKSTLVYSKSFTLYKYYNTEEFTKHSFC